MTPEQRQQKILQTIRDIPSGMVASYGQIAEIAGVPRGARQVGYALRTVPPGEKVPWHRVLRSSGQIAFDRSQPQFAKQQSRLRAEGVIVERGRVDMKRYRWQPDLDELLWKPAMSGEDE